MENAFGIVSERNDQRYKYLVRFKSTSSGGRIALFPEDWHEHCGHPTTSSYSPSFNLHGYEGPGSDWSVDNTYGTIYQKFSGGS